MEDRLLTTYRRLFPLTMFTNKNYFGGLSTAPHLKKHYMKKEISFLAILFVLSACETESLAPDAFDYALRQPAYFPPVTYNLENNPVTKAGFELGKQLFNDPILSIDNSVACSNCHVKAVAFTDPQHKLSLGVHERAGTRNAPMIANLAFQKEFLLDGGISHLDFVAVFAIENPNEMGETLAGVVTKLNRSQRYRDWFREVFPETDSITSPYFLKALSQYMLLLVSDQSKYDQVIRGEATFSPAEAAGYEVFNKNCASCHSGHLFTNQQFINNGLDESFSDPGRATITETTADLGKFKVPSLRNITRTAPYMHDGRFSTLEEVIDHYQTGIKVSTTLDAALIQDGRSSISLSPTAVNQLLEFLETLTDYEFLSNPVF